ncbi:MAG: hypothetical protein KGI29_01020 [Pseudomonadota bacterium]|nr:hypothetical protein [Pseudomonadota bacterium]MDE3037042.1 hypothetical protein [Pseudomonadota bacterium]
MADIDPASFACVFTTIADAKGVPLTPAMSAYIEAARQAMQRVMNSEQIEAISEIRHQPVERIRAALNNEPLDSTPPGRVGSVNHVHLGEAIRSIGTVSTSINNQIMRLAKPTGHFQIEQSQEARV